MFEYIGHFGHLHHEGGLAGGQIIGRADAGEHPVTMPITADFAGTKEPIWAMRTMSAVWRIWVDLPAILGPVTMATRSSPPLRKVSLGTKASCGLFHHGMAALGNAYLSGCVHFRHGILFLTAVSARAHSTSSRATRSAADLPAPPYRPRSARTSSKSGTPRSAMRSLAVSRVFSSSLSSWVKYRSLETSVCLRM